MDKKEEVKVGLDTVSNCYEQLEHCCHGNEAYYAIKKLMEYKGKIYILHGEKGYIETDEGGYYHLGGQYSRYEIINHILEEFNIPKCQGDSAKVHVSFLEFDDVDLINEDGTLGEVDREIYEEIRKLRSISLVTNDETFVTKEQDEDDIWEEDEYDVELREDIVNDQNRKYDISLYGQEAEISLDTINCSEIPAHIKLDEKTGKTIITAYGKNFVYDEMKRKQKESQLREGIKEDSDLNEALLKAETLEKIQENENKEVNEG